MNLNQKYTLCRDIQWQVVENEAIILNMNSGDYFSLNDTATDIFLGVVKDRSLASMISKRKETHRKSKPELKKDTIDLLQDLIKNRIIKKAS